jgi:signal transduction histidine kinase
VPANSTGTPAPAPPAPRQDSVDLDRLGWVVPAVLVPFALCVVLLWNTRRSETARREVESRVLADYGAIAARQFSVRLDSTLHEQMTRAFHAIAHSPDGMPRRHIAAAAPALLLTPSAAAADIPLLQGARSAFRFEIPTGRFVWAGPPFDSATQRVLASHLRRLAGRGESADPHAAIADTVVARRVYIPVFLRHVPGGTAEMAYGFEASTEALGVVLRDVLRRERLLPSGLLDPPYSPNALRVTLHAAGGAELWRSTADSPNSMPGIDTVRQFLGGAVVRVYAGSAVASALRIGRASPMYVPVLVALLGLSLALGVTAIVQVRRAREMAAARHRFIANVSLEIRTPLTQMSMFAEMLAEGRVRSETERVQFVQIIARETKRLSTLVDSVLRFSRARGAQVPMIRESRDLVEEVRDACEFFASVVGAAGMTLRLAAPEPAPVSVEPGAIRQILLNLIDNAVKYGAAGQVITAAVLASDGLAVVTISDAGRGIPVEDRQRVFQPFVRLEHRAQGVAGTGIGMSVVHDLVTAHGGKIWIGEAPAGGAAVSFALPLRA